MLINNQIVHSHEIAKGLVQRGWGALEFLPEKAIRVKFNGKFVYIKDKGEWTSVSNAKRAFKAYLKRSTFLINDAINYAQHNIDVHYHCDKSDIENIYNQFIADGIVEFVEVTI